MAKLFGCNEIVNIINTHDLKIEGLWFDGLEESINEVDSIEMECRDLFENSGFDTVRFFHISKFVLVYSEVLKFFEIFSKFSFFDIFKNFSKFFKTSKMRVLPHFTPF